MTETKSQADSCFTILYGATELHITYIESIVLKWSLSLFLFFMFVETVSDIIYLKINIFLLKNYNDKFVSIDDAILPFNHF